ncbi:MAG: transcription factor E [Candidatus Hodarchaeales archaeon]
MRPLADFPAKNTVSNLLFKVIETLMGEETVVVAEYLIKHPGAIDEEIAETIEMNIKSVRNCLFKLNEQSLAKFRRIRNPDTGYFVYYWTFESERLLNLVERRKKQILKLLSQRSEYEERNLLYSCENSGCLPVVLDMAYELNFSCPNCGEALDQQDNEKIQQFLEDLNSKLSKL